MKKPILLVDDEDDFVEIAMEQLVGLTYSGLISVVRNGVDALAFLRKKHPFETAPTPSLVILDIKMPRLDGHAVLAEMKADPELRNIPVVVLTCSTMDKDRDRALAAGAVHYLSKLPDLEKMKEITARFAVG